MVEQSAKVPVLATLKFIQVYPRVLSQSESTDLALRALGMDHFCGDVVQGFLKP